mmetsp:Transcript_17105/g.30644  ORF Transcript_17105/g.30644 Transcript_17105/m.30644 type:complete len:286 (+) Transcript_17105:313-1170(+)|eukprot:CAMPEP_0197529344 /NCGR_PEP_ID=MMETSP1318-20131121/28092_1 /TAXON_ID=552666 /ORGANISM="Partenskyella glossopodia, Strain RCC365" /LENGTH=285 /DNA_ID=CAMNT_0043084771 /DNA_START=253 /DNA_END=1110 /DNA_ORIENTATION=-
MAVIIYPRDYVLLIALMLMCILVLINWNDYNTCKDPLNVWLVVDFLSFIFFRLLQFCIQFFGSFGPNCARLTTTLAVVNLYVVYPFIWLWVVIGTIWYSRSSECLPESTSTWWFVAWLVYSYLYLAAFGALIISFCRMRNTSRREMRSIEQLQQLLNDYMHAESYGLQPMRSGYRDDQINDLRCRHLSPSEVVDKTCPVCLNDLEEGDETRVLACPHLFHKDCIDRWLKMRQTCPICRTKAIQDPDEASLLLAESKNHGSQQAVNAAAASRSVPIRRHQHASSAV